MNIKSSKAVKKRYPTKLVLGLPLIVMFILIHVFNAWGKTETKSFVPNSLVTDSGTELRDNPLNENESNNLMDFFSTSSMPVISGAAIFFSTDTNPPKELTNVIDKVRMSSLDGISYGEWTATYGTDGEFISASTTQNGKFHSSAGFRMTVDWSTKGEPISAGDFFTIRLPEGFIESKYLANATNSVLHEDANDDSSPIIANYTIELLSDSVSNDSDVLITVTFSDFVNAKDKITGDFWLKCFSVSFDGADPDGETKTVEFEINKDGNLHIFSMDVTVLPPPPSTLWEPIDYNYYKYGSCSPTSIINGYYYFYWNMYINMDFNTKTPITDHFKIEDVIPYDSPHKFITPADKAVMETQKDLHFIMIREYIGADDALYDTPEKRYAKLKEDYNADGSENWIYKLYRWNGNPGYYLPDSENIQVLAGIDGGTGINVAGTANPASDAAYISDDRKTLDLDIGRVTRPTIISYYTIAEKELAESALGSSGTVSAFKNNVRFYSEDSDFGENSGQVVEYSFTAGGSGTGSAYDKDFSFIKTGENGNVLQGARFVLYNDVHCTGIAQGMATSDALGRVKFTGLKAGTYYMKEDIAPSGYVASDKIYKVNLSSLGAEIFSGEDFTALLTEPIKILNSAFNDTGDLLIKKVDGSTGNDLTGAVYEIYHDDKLVKTVILGGEGMADGDFISLSENGYWLVTGLESSKEYKIKEVIPPIGYLLNETEDENTQTVYISCDQTPDTIPKIVFTDYSPETSSYTSRLKITKHDNLGRPLNGAVFEIYTKDEPGILVAIADMSDTNIWISDWLPRGVYTVIETIAPKGTNEILPKYIGDVELKGKTEEITILVVKNALLEPEQPTEQEQPSEPEEPSEPEQPPESEQPSEQEQLSEQGQPIEPGKPIVPTKPQKPNAIEGSEVIESICYPNSVPLDDASDNTPQKPELPTAQEVFPIDSNPMPTS